MLSSSHGKNTIQEEWITFDSLENDMNGFDIDGVISVGIYPGPNDVIITGRSYEEEEETMTFLRGRGITNKVYFNPLPFAEKTRQKSGIHKAWMIQKLNPEIFFEDDPVQWQIIEYLCPDVKVVKVVHELTEKENVRHIGET